MTTATTWDASDCIRRYSALEASRPDLFQGQTPAAYRILTDAAMIERAKAEAAAFRANSGMSNEDTRVGVLAYDPYVIALREAVAFPDGGLGLYNRFIVPRGIVVVPLLRGAMVVLYRYRHGTRAWHYEFPRGIIEPGEADKTAVQRELLEEIGATASEIVALSSIHSSSGITNEFSETFVARLDALGAPDRHEAVLRIETLDHDAFRQKIASGAITDGPTLAAYAQAAARGLID